MGRKAAKRVGTLMHDEASRKNIPTAEYESLMATEDQNPVEVAYKRCSRDLDPQLVWRGKHPTDYSDLVVQAPPLFIQEKVHPKVLVDDLMKRGNRDSDNEQPDLFAGFNGLPDNNARTEFYRHDAHWTNRLILGDSLQVMASLAEREGLRGKVQCIYVDPPYGIKFNSNFQWSTTSRNVTDGKVEHITREPEQVKAFRDTWRDGIHSYLTYLRDRLTVARDLLADSGSVFLQIGDENVHRVRAVMDEVFGDENFVNQINCRTNSGTTRGDSLKRSCDYLLWYAKNSTNKKFRRLVIERKIDTKMYNQLLFPDKRSRSMTAEEKSDPSLAPANAKPFCTLPLHSMSAGDNTSRFAFGEEWTIPSNRSWRHSQDGFVRLLRSSRVQADKTALRSRYFHSDYPVSEFTESWSDTGPEINKSYVVQTSQKIVQRCLLMATDPGDLVLDPTCGSGTTAYVAEHWGRRWIAIDTSRVALALARARIMGAQYPYFLLADSEEGRKKETELPPPHIHLSELPTRGDIRQGFVYERVPYITLKSIAHNTEIDVIWEKYQQALEPLRENLNRDTGNNYADWEVPHDPDGSWTSAAIGLHAKWWEQRIARQREIDDSIAMNADYQYLYDKPYIDKKIVRVSGPFTVESASPHRVLITGEDGEPIDPQRKVQGISGRGDDFADIIIEQLKMSGVQQAHKEDKITFTALMRWPGKMICGEGRYLQNERERSAAIFVGPEFGTVSRLDLVEAAREAADADFDVLISCAFNYDAHASEFDRIGKVPVLKARMNADLHMSEDLKNTGKGNLFVIFGEPDIEIIPEKDDCIVVKINGVDVFHPNSGEIRSHDSNGIACWFIDTDYNQESFFVRHAYFLGTNDPFKALKATLKAEINMDALNSLNSDKSHPFSKPASGRIAVKVINHLGDEVMKVFKV